MHAAAAAAVSAAVTVVAAPASGAAAGFDGGYWGGEFRGSYLGVNLVPHSVKTIYIWRMCPACVIHFSVMCIGIVGVLYGVSVHRGCLILRL